MSPTRRQFLYAFGAASAAAVYVAQGPFTRLVLADDQTTVQVVDAHGLPPTTRLENVRCLECGNPLGQLVVDEMQSFNGFNGYACGDCFKKKVDEIEDMSSESDVEDKLDDARQEVRDELEADLEELRTDLRDLQRKHKAVEGIAERMRWQLVDLRTAPHYPARQIERIEETLDAFWKGV